ncbi:PhnD/SsuA/transferrin family substrate-binding protein [Dokdonella sp.]|uniref:phosphate/phosphite/phosphonate ABC transporter substrate-binding protein n=1 Tax=Dokdonella sp. TaxID=2291710 RepID=UPI001B18E3C0|nr:PhnD/SsuA/transferrin family substrate-binding protein [Dokdonella sp.]MBO9661563.1 PhnD/SsuA/transferrin family substrate-binding protein [Dokdonella sp.]
MRMPRSFRRTVALLLALSAGIAGADGGERTNGAAVLATYAYPKYDRAAALQPLADVLAARLKTPVTVRLFDSPRALVEAVRSGAADLAVTNTFAGLALLDAAQAQPLAVFEVPRATAERYRGVLLARVGAGPDDDGALARTAAQWRIAQAVRGSTSGGLVQDLHLAALGRRADYAALNYAGTHEGALAALRAGEADVAALAETPWRDALAREPALASQVRELWRSPPIPPGPLVCRDGGRLSCPAARALLLELHREAPAALAALAGAWSEAAGATRLVAVDRAGYLDLAQGFRSAGEREAALRRLLD